MAARDRVEAGRGRSWPARVLAPLALLAVVAAVALIVSGSLEGEDESAPAGGERQGGGGREATNANGGDDGDEQEQEGGQGEDRPDTYEVQSGDSLSTIADEFGISVRRLQRLNPDAEPQALVTGQTLKLR